MRGTTGGSIRLGLLRNTFSLPPDISTAPKIGLGRADPILSHHCVEDIRTSTKVSVDALFRSLVHLCSVSRTASLPQRLQHPTQRSLLQHVTEHSSSHLLHLHHTAQSSPSPDCVSELCAAKRTRCIIIRARGMLPTAGSHRHHRVASRHRRINQLVELQLRPVARHRRSEAGEASTSTEALGSTAY